jgi:hypothetical protein
MKHASAFRSLYGRSNISTIHARVFCGLVLVFSITAPAQQPANSEQPSPAGRQAEAAPTHSTAPPTPLRDLVDEADRNNPQIAA